MRSAGRRAVVGGMLVAALALSGCVSGPAAGGASVVPSAGVPSSSGEPSTGAAEISGTFDVGGGRRMYLHCAGERAAPGAPTVVLVSGQRGSADDWLITSPGVSSPPVFALLTAGARVCAYDRPGTPVGDAPSRSDPVEQPANAGDMVADLHALLTAAGVGGPLVMVGHSAGGLVARLFASSYPGEVVGMVLVDALSEYLRQFETPEQWAIQKPLLRGEIDASLAEYPALEWVDADTSFDQLIASAPLRPMPLVVISADHPIGPTIPALKASGAIGPEVPDDFGFVVDAAQAKAQAALAALVPGSVFITRTDSGHNVHQEQPALVAREILDVVRRASGPAG